MEKTKQRSTGRSALEKRGHKRLIAISIIILAGLILIGMTPRILRFIALKKHHQQLVNQIPANEAVVVRSAPSDTLLTLPGDTQAIQQVPILARADGYLAQRYVDIGDKIRKNQIVAEISTPDVDQQYLQAQADLRAQRANLDSSRANHKHFLAAFHASQAAVLQTKANVDYDTLELKRYQSLAGEGAVSLETRDTYLKQYKADQAALKTNQENEAAARLQADAALEQEKAAEQTVQSFQANEGKLAALKGFQKIYAPSDGVITARYVDPGNLISSGGNGTRILAMARMDVLRIFVQVPQSVYRSISVGDNANVIVPEFPDKTFKGTVTNVSGGLDRQSRTLQVEVHVDNKQLTLPPGVYAEVQFNVRRTTPACLVPINAVTNRSQGSYVVLVKGGRTHLRPIQINRDYGATLETSSVKDGDIILLDPPDDTREGQPIRALIQPPVAAP